MSCNNKSCNQTQIFFAFLQLPALQLIFNATWVVLILALKIIVLREMTCIVLYLYIYIALLEVHTNQKRFQSERPREKRAVNFTLVGTATCITRTLHIAAYL